MTGDHRQLAVGGLALAVVIFFAVNIFANSAFKGLRLDLTEQRLFTLSQGTRDVLASMDEPVIARLYFSKLLGEVNPRHLIYYNRVRELLEQYSEVSGGRLRLELFNPEPFTDDEDRAVAFGLQGLPVNEAGDKGYFGLAVTNSTDDREVVTYMSPQREPFLEYDLTRLIQGLVNPEPKVVGVISALPINGNPTAQQPRWAVIDQIADFFEVRGIDNTEKSIPGEVDMLLIAHPKGLNEQLQYAIDQFVLRGKPAMVFVDANSELEIAMARGEPEAGPSQFDQQLAAWGLRLKPGVVAGDLDTARRVNVSQGGKVAVADYVLWLSLDGRNFNADDPVTSDLNRVNLATGGVIEAVEAAGTTLTPLISTGERAMSIETAKVRVNPDVAALFREFKPDGKPLTLAARVQGKPKTAFPEGPPKPAEASAEAPPADGHLSEAAGPVSLIVVADTDMLHNQFWVDSQNVLGQSYTVPYADNANLVLNALENMAGGANLVGLRSRGETTRPFRMVQRIRQDAELKYRAKEQVLAGKLTEVQENIAKLLSRENSGGEVMVTPEDRLTADSLRREMISLRRQLRDVQHALRKEIDDLDMRLKFLNIAAIPLLLGAIALVLALVRRSRRAATPRARAAS